jgi:predicted nuclease with RNAse H fold
MFIDLHCFGGIDFGSRLAGTTSLCINLEGKMQIFQSKKGEDADILLSKWITVFQISTVFIDAPLSIPGAYYNKGVDFMYRDADRTIKAMSPMFLGGLTARAMQLQAQWKQMGVTCVEVYPGGWIRDHALASETYLKKSSGNTSDFMQFLKKEYPAIDFPKVDNWHQVDSVICWLIGHKYLLGQAIAIGHPDEGQIWI